MRKLFFLLIDELFKLGFLSLVIFTLAEILKNGLISNYYDLNWHLLGTIILFIISLVDLEQQKKNQLMLNLFIGLVGMFIIIMVLTFNGFNPTSYLLSVLIMAVLYFFSRLD